MITLHHGFFSGPGFIPGPVITGRDHSVERRVNLFNTGDTGIEQFDRRQGFISDHPPGLQRSQVTSIGHDPAP